MTITQINYFLEVVRHQSVSKAATHLYVSQPAVSKQVSLLEKSLGVMLFDRSSGGAVLTQVGQIYFEFFERAEKEFRTVEAKTRQMITGQTGELRLGCLDGWDLSSFYPELKNLLIEKYPFLLLSLS